LALLDGVRDLVRHHRFTRLRVGHRVLVAITLQGNIGATALSISWLATISAWHYWSARRAPTASIVPATIVPTSAPMPAAMPGRGLTGSGSEYGGVSS